MKNLFDCVYVNDFCPKFEPFFTLLVRCNKCIISDDVKSIEPFPLISQLYKKENVLLFDQALLNSFKETFDSIKTIDQFERETVAGLKIQHKIKSKRALAKKRKKQKFVIDCALKKSRSKYKKDSIEFSNTFKLYLAAINLYYLSFPPQMLNKKRFEELLLSVKNLNDKKLLMEIYTLNENGCYCAQNRLSGKNFKEVMNIIFNAKHIQNEDKR